MDSSLLSALTVVAIAFIALRSLPRLLSGAAFVDPQAVKARMDDNPDALMIDVRTPEEFKQCHVPDSLNVQPFELGNNMDEKKQYLDTKVYLMCLSSQRAAMAARTMKQLGFSNVAVVKGGLKLWKKRGLPTT